MAPARRAFDSPMAIACLGLPVLCLPRFMCRISFPTICSALGPYLRRLAEVERREREAVVARVRPRRLEVREDAAVRREAVERPLAAARLRVLAAARRERRRVRVEPETAARDVRRRALAREAEEVERRRLRLALARLLPVAGLRAERERDVAVRLFAAIGLAS